MDYANYHNIKLNLNEKNNYGYFPILNIFSKNNIEMIQLLMDYANYNNIKLELNKKTNNGSYLLLFACKNNNVEMA